MRRHCQPEQRLYFLLLWLPLPLRQQHLREVEGEGGELLSRQWLLPLLLRHQHLQDLQRLQGAVEGEAEERLQGVVGDVAEHSR